jgi:hypothetical protein
MLVWTSLLCIDLKRVRNSSARFGHLLARKDSALNIRCTLRMRFCSSYFSSFKTLFSMLVYIVLNFGKIWVSMCVVRQPAPYPMGTRDSFPGGKAAGREADHSSPSSAEVKNAWNYTLTPQYVFMGWCLIKHRDFTLFI